MNQVLVYSSLAGDPELHELVEIFVQEIPDKINALETHARSCDWQQLTRIAHQLKGAAGSYGFNAITPYAARLESALKDGREEDEILLSLNELLALCRGVRSGVSPTEDDLGQNTESEIP
jgi:HPt (histidine-containing phosphotransfer) domain-containing protein